MTDFRELTDEQMERWWLAYREAHKACISDDEAARRAYAAIGIVKNW